MDHLAGGRGGKPGWQLLDGLEEAEQGIRGRAHGDLGAYEDHSSIDGLYLLATRYMVDMESPLVDVAEVMLAVAKLGLHMEDIVYPFQEERLLYSVPD
jgi:hypothetical protein